MGGCVPEPKKPSRLVQTPSKTSTSIPEEPQSSKLRVQTSNTGNIFTRTSSPIDNTKIIRTFEQLQSSIQTINIDSLNHCDWRKVSCPPLKDQRIHGICQWVSPEDRVLNGQSLLYHNEKNNQYLVGGCFVQGRLNKSEKCFKIFENGAYYVGFLNGDFVPHGQGELRVSESQYHKGYFNEGVPHGDGEKCQNGKKFIGTFKRGQIIKGKQITEKGTYEGPFKNNLKHGKGLLRMNSGLRYEGEFENNKKVGNGTLIDKDNKVLYKGKWVDDKQKK